MLEWTASKAGIFQNAAKPILANMLIMLIDPIGIQFINAIKTIRGLRTISNDFNE